MSEPISYQPELFGIQFLAPDCFVTAHEWTHGRDGNVNPVIHARFATPDGAQFDAYAKPFTAGNEHDATLALNEATGWLLARACGLPVPERAFFTALTLAELPPYPGTTTLPPPDANGHVLCFATQDAGAAAVRGLYTDEALAQEQARWPHCNATIALDEALANPDRHIFNLLRRRANDFVLIDHGFLLRRNPNHYPEHWQPGMIEQMVNMQLPNVLHHNTYVYQGRTAPEVCTPACQACEGFMSHQRPQLQRALFEIAFWCSKLLPGRSAQWLQFLYSRMQPANLSPLLYRRFGLLPLHA